MVLPILESDGCPPPIKRLLCQAGATYLFEVREFDRTYFTVEWSQSVCEYTLLGSAESKFIRVVNRSCVK